MKAIVNHLILLASLAASIQTYANVIGIEDGRYPLTVKGPELGLSPEEILKLRKAVGICACPGTVHGNGAMVSCAVTGFESIVLGSATIVVDQQGRLREPLNECTFQSLEEGAKPIPLDFSKSYVIGSKDRMANPENFFALVRLKRPHPPIAPLFIGLFKPKAFEGRELITVSAPQKPMKRQVPPNEPIIQVCQNREVFVPMRGNEWYFWGDCDATEMSSGSVHLVRSEKGKLMVYGILVEPGNFKYENQPYNPKEGSYHGSVVVGPLVVDQITKMYLEDLKASDVEKPGK